MYCINCGNKLTKNDKFCSKCGKNQTEENVPINTNELGKGRAIASLVIGCICVVFGGFLIPLPIIGLILAFSYKGKCSEKTAGIILNSIGLVLSIISFLFILLFGIIIFTGAIDDGSYSNNLNNIGEWNTYSKYVENDNLDPTTNIVGNWKELSNYRSLLTFSENEYYFYDDILNMENSYTTGTYEIYSGSEAFDKIGINNKIFNKVLGKIVESLEEENFYIIKLNPTLTIKDGVSVPNEIDDNKLYRSLFINTHDNVVELTLSGFENNEMKHFYKVLMSNE